MIDPSRIIILSMFCNHPGYVGEKTAVEKTWGQCAVKAGFRHIFYTEAPPGAEPGLCGNILYVECGGGRMQTYDKTALALKYVDENLEYDAVVKTNVSTYVNVGLLKQALTYWFEHDSSSVYGNTMLYSPRKLMWLRGDFTLLRRDVCREIAQNYEETKAIFKNGDQDDSIMFYVMYGKHGLDFCKRLKTIPSATCRQYSYNDVKSVCAARLKISYSESFGEICKRIYAFHKAVAAEKRSFRFNPVFNKAKVKAKHTAGNTKISYDDAVRAVTKKSRGVVRAPYGRIAVYTCITGGYDRLRPVKHHGAIFDFICFSDAVTPEMRRSGWQIRSIPPDLSEFSNVKKQRMIKICPHRYLSEYKVSLWLDANIVVNDDIWNAVKKYDLSKYPLYTNRHPQRDCVYDEELVCVRLGKDTAENTRPQIEKIRNDGFPAHAGLAETGIIFRKHDDAKCIETMETWAKVLAHGSHRDQLSFNYACWKTGLEYGELRENYRKPTAKDVFVIEKHHRSQTQKVQKKNNGCEQRNKCIPIFPA